MAAGALGVEICFIGYPPVCYCDAGSRRMSIFQSVYRLETCCFQLQSSLAGTPFQYSTAEQKKTSFLQFFTFTKETAGTRIALFSVGDAGRQHIGRGQ